MESHKRQKTIDFTANEYQQERKDSKAAPSTYDRTFFTGYAYAKQKHRKKCPVIHLG
jgi:ABC-type uncharacterized transport system substrate-binding protein